MDARHQAQARYREKNLEEEQEKAREHMARYVNMSIWLGHSLISILEHLFSYRYRKKVLTQEDSRAAAAFLERAREASRKHRQKYGLGGAGFN
ncbi:hypothetical protein B0H14DRAFT_3434500 [Mycena olivaceomarginata]|nr:hypothetical protein B0H14DRAFT_3434500 [Mycena olivaceomarginata]